MSNEKRKEEVVWLASESLPAGWKMRNPPGRFLIFYFTFLDALASLELDMPLSGYTIFCEILSTGNKVKQNFRQ